MTQFALNNRLVQMELWGSSNAARETDAKAWWLAFRNALRTLLAPNANFKVGDLFRWQGAAGKYGHGFLIRLGTSAEWLIAGSADGNDSSASAAYFSSIFQNTSASYFLRDGSSPTSVSSYFSGMLFCANLDTSNTWNIGYDANLALSGGDWTAPTSNPHTALAAFWTASKAPFGIAFTDRVFEYRAIQAFHVLIDDTEKMLRVDMLAPDTSFDDQRSAYNKIVYLGGEGFGSYANNAEGGLADVGDTNQCLNAVLGWHCGAAQVGITTGQQFGVEGLNRFYVMNLAGTTRLSDTVLSPIKDITKTNYKSLSGAPKVRAVEVKSGTVLKGTLKKKIALEAFPYRDGLLGPQILEYPAGSGNKLIREHESVCIMWLDGKSVWPYAVQTSELPY